LFIFSPLKKTNPFLDLMNSSKCFLSQPTFNFQTYMKLSLSVLLLLLTLLGFSQSPSLINYQGVARDANGNPITGALGLKFELRQGSANGGTVFTEQQTVTAGSLGVFNTQIGKINGSNLSTVNWQAGTLFLEVSISLSGGTYTSMGAQQLVSVPYALNATSVPASYTNNILTIGSQVFTLSPANGAVYTASTGIAITSGSVITNTSPDVPVTFTSSSSNITINGAYPDFGISYSATPIPASLTLNGNNNNNLSAGNNTVVLNTYTAGSGINMSGGPNYTISSSASNPTVNGAGVAVVSPTTGSNFTVTVPNPSISVTGTLLTLSQGTAVSTATLNPPTLALSGTNNNSLTAGNNTVILNTYTTGSGITMSGGPNYTISSSASNPTVNGAGVAVVSPTTGSNFTVTVPNPSISVTGTLLTLSQGAAVSTATLNPPSLSLSGPNNNSLTAGNNTVALNTYTVGSGLTIAGGPNYTISSSAANPTISGTGIAVVSPTTGSNFAVNVPGPALSVSGSTLTINQGTTSSSAIIPTTTVTASGIASVAVSGLSYNVNVPTPNFLSTGATSIQGSYPNYTVVTSASPGSTMVGTGAAVVTPTTGSNYVINVPVSALTSTFGIASISSAGTNSFNINVPAPAYNSVTGALNTGTATTNIIQALTFSNNILTSGPSTNTVSLPTSPNTSISPAGSASVTGAFPSFTVSAPAQPTIIGTGLAVVSPSTGANITVSVPLLTYTASTGILASGTNTLDMTSPLVLSGTTLSAGPSSNSVNLSTISPFTTTGANIYQATLTNSVGIGTNAPTAKLDVVESATYAGSHLKVQNTNPSNTSNMVDFTSIGGGNVLNVFSNNSSTATVAGLFDGGIISRGKTVTSSGYAFRVLNSISNDLFVVRNDGNVGVGTSNPSALLHVINTSLFDAIAADVTNVSNGGNALQIRHFGIGNAGFFQINNASGASAIEATSNSGSQNTVRSVSSASNLSVYAGYFDGGLVTRGKNSLNSAYAFRAQNSASSDLLAVLNDGNVGIGTSNPATKLHLHSSTSNFVQARLTHTATSSFGLVLSSDATNATLLNYDNTNFFFGTNGANRMVISNTGSVGIGPGAMSPAARLDVDGTVKIKDNTEGPGKVLTSDAVGNASWQQVGVPSGAIMAYGGTTIPAGWVLCDGATYPRTATTYSNLFVAIGSAWGAGNGTTTFNVPDMRGMFLRGVQGTLTPALGDPDNLTRVASNTGGNTGNNVGSKQADEFEVHNHTIGSSINVTALLATPAVGPGGSGNTTGNAGGSTETRPKNVYVYYIIKL
jgi:hypothetical protein